MILDTKLTDIAIKNNILQMFDCYELETQRQFTSLVSKGSNPDEEWARKFLKFDSTVKWGEQSYLYYTLKCYNFQITLVVSRGPYLFFYQFIDYWYIIWLFCIFQF